MRAERCCPICQTPGRAVYENRMAPLDDLDMSYRVALCPQCGFGFADRLPDAAAYTRYYSGYSKYDLIRSREAVPLLVATMAESAVDFILRHVGAQAGVFDIGCSVGVFLDACRRRGMARVGGIDPAPQAAVIGREQFGVDIATGFFDGSQDLSGWDLVSLIAVLEHLTSPQEVFAALARAMRPGAFLYIEVPAGDRFADIRGEVFGEFSLEHINFFGAVSLRRLAARHGFVEVAGDHPFYTNGTWGVRSLFRLQAAAEASARDTALEQSLGRYIEDGRAGVAAQCGRLRAWSGRPLAIYGAGSHTARLLAYPDAAGLSVAAVVDGNPNLQGKRLGGHLVQPPAVLQELGVPVLISSYQARHALARIVGERYGLEALRLYDA